MTQYLLIWTRAQESHQITILALPKQTKIEVASFDVCSHKRFD